MDTKELIGYFYNIIESETLGMFDEECSYEEARYKAAIKCAILHCKMQLKREREIVSVYDIQLDSTNYWYGIIKELENELNKYL